MNWLDVTIMLGFAAAFVTVLLLSRRNGRSLSEADKAAAAWIARQARAYGPLSQAQVRQAAATARARGADRRRGRENRMLAHGLAKIAGDMRPGERVARSVPAWRRL